MVTSGVPSGVHTGTYLHQSHNGIKCTPGTFADHMKLSGGVDMSGESDAIQRDLDSSLRAHGNLLGFSKAECRVLPLGQGNSQNQYSLGKEELV